MKMVERMARAICCPDGCAGDTGSGNPCDIAAEDRTAMQQALAALKALREPTEAMLADGRDAIEPYVQRGLSTPVGHQWQIAGETWHAMIDAAISEATQKEEER